LSKLGVFNVAQQIAAIITLLTNAINMAWVPIFYAEAGKDEQSPLFSLFANFLIFILVLGGLSISILAPELVTALMSPEYKAASRYIPYLILAYIIGNGYWLLLINPLAFSKKTIYTPALTILSGSLSVALNIYLIPLLGLEGAAISTCVSYFVLILITYYIFKKHSAVRYDFKAINKMVIVGVIIYLISLQISFADLWLNVLLKAFLLLFYCTVLQSLKIYSFDKVKLFFKSQSKI
jgi:O-antigen/teichoic acid export membrane protein